MRSLGSEEVLSPHADFTEVVCVCFQNCWEGLWAVAREVVTSDSIYCTDFVG